jgi:hypothetical protein
MATNRTLLANLGFSDPDKKLKTHDLGVSFLAQIHIIEKIIPLYFKGYRFSDMCKFFSTGESWMSETSFNKNKFTLIPGYKIIGLGVRTEFPVSKGEKQYMQTIGFLDGIISVNISHIHKKYVCTNITHRRKNYTEVDERGKCPCEVDNKECLWDDGIEIIKDEIFSIYIEVKITPQTSGDIIRQINLYRGHIGNKIQKFLLAYNFDLSETEIKTIEAENILCVRLGSQFETWCKEKLSEKSVDNQNRLEF